MPNYTLTVNGRRQTVMTCPADMPLLWVLRDVLNLKGTKFGCGVVVLRRLHRARREQRRSVPAHAHLQGDVSRSRRSKDCRPTATHPLQVAWRDIDVPQCGYCQAGQLMSAAALLQNHTEAD